MEAISTGCYRIIWSLDGSQESQILQETLQVKWTASKMVSEVIGL